MVWIHGGGYTLGSKIEYSPSAAGMILESQDDGSAGIVWVGINYRLGVFVSSRVIFAVDITNSDCVFTRDSYPDLPSMAKAALATLVSMTSALL